MISHVSLFTKLTPYSTTRLMNLTHKITGHFCQKMIKLSFSNRAGEVLSTDFLATPSATSQKRKTTAIIPKITLLKGNDITITTLEEAQKLSKRRDLKLVKIIDLDIKSERPIFKLMTPQECHAEDLKQRELQKKEKGHKYVIGEKLLLLSQNISERDLETQIRKVLKWIEKSYEARIVVNGDASNISKAETVYNSIEKRISNSGRIVQKRQKGGDIKFQILPPKKSDKSSKDSPGDTGNND